MTKEMDASKFMVMAGRALRRKMRRDALSLLDNSLPWREKVRKIDKLTRTEIYVY